MKVNPKNILGLAALGMALLAVTVPTWAGRTTTSEVSLWDSSDFLYARGSMEGVRYSADSTQYIGCSSYASGSPVLVLCIARDKTSGNYFSCMSQDATLQEAVQAMTDSSSIFLEVAKNNPSICSRIQIYDGSDNLK